MLEIKGIPSKEEALALYDDWKKERDDWNNESSKHDAILFWCTIIGCALSVAGVFWSSGWAFDMEGLGAIRSLLLIFIPVIGFMIILFNWEGQWEYSELSWPMKYQYYVTTRDKTILESKIEDGALHFVLENSNHEVTTDVLAGFKKKYRTDISEIVVDLDNEEILIPYKK